MNLIARPWKPQDLLDELQLMIQEQSDSYANSTRTALCMAHDYLKEYFSLQQNVPLTINELLNMEGQPLYIQVRWTEEHSFEGWALLDKSYPDGFFLQFDGKYYFLLTKWYGSSQDVSWSAFRRKVLEG